MVDTRHEHETVADFYVPGMPPTRQRAFNPKEWDELRERQKRFREAAQKAFKKPFPVAEEVSVFVRYQRFESKQTSVDMLGGIMDALRKVIIADDYNVTELTYVEQQGYEDGCWVIVKVTHPRSSHAHDHTHGHAG